ncbi:MAG: acyl carrier protein [Desulfobacterales bacterium]|nr:MAG: acyl carrier protein [Desulfobacterales bacterium]
MSNYQDMVVQICEILKPLVADGQVIQEETDLLADLGLDSLQVMKVLEAVEDRFDVSIPLNILPDVRTVQDFAVQLQRLSQEGQ